MNDGDRRAQLADNLAQVEARIATACTIAGRSRADVTLIVVTKTHPASDVDLLVELGITDIGENRHPEAGRKVDQLAGPRPRLHFVGGLQTNKANAVARYADIVQSVDRVPLVEALSHGAVKAGRELGCLVQVDFGEAVGRSGVAPSDVPRLAAAVASADGLRLDGVMTVAPLGVDPRPSFDHLLRISQSVRRDHPAATLISAGMSDDFEAAVESGANTPPVGRSILGERVLLG